MNSRRRWALVWTVAIIFAGLAVRRAPLHLPAIVSKYGGSCLWAAMIYTIFVAILPKRPPLEIGVAAGLFALAVELFKLVHTPGLDAFRLTLPGQLLIGRVFSFGDVAAYWVVILLLAVIDRSIPTKIKSKRRRG